MTLSKAECIQTQKFFCKHHKNASVQAHWAENKSVLLSKHNQNFSEQKQKESNQISFNSFQFRTDKKKESSNLAGLKKPLSTTPNKAINYLFSTCASLSYSSRNFVRIRSIAVVLVCPTSSQSLSRRSFISRRI